MLNFSLYLSLFFSSFISATLIPFSSEATLLVMLAYGLDSSTLLIVATIGNTIGSITTYGIAYYGSDFLLNLLFKKNLDKAQRYALKARNYGAYMAFFAFLPLIGDILCLALGLIKYNFYKAIIFIALGKFLRYALIVFVYEHSLLHIFKKVSTELMQYI